jgi:hypothetical protein
MMATPLDDPRNHAPAVSPDDGWGDMYLIAAPLEHRQVAAPVVLPPKRTPATRAESTDHDRIETGLRIDITPQPREADEPPFHLEVEEINGSVVRLDAVIEPPPKVPRQNTFKPRRATEEQIRHGEGREWGRASRHSLAWILGSSLGIAAVVVVSLMMLPMINESNAARPRPGQIELVVDSDDTPEGVEALNAMVARRPQAFALFTRFAVASSAEEILPTVRDPDGIQPLLGNPAGPLVDNSKWSLPAETTWGALENEGLVYGLLEGPLPDFARFRCYVVVDTDHALRIDWKATTAFGSADFNQLAAGSGDPSEIRAWISPTGFYTAVFPEADFQSFQLVAPDRRESIWCYTRRGDATDQELSNQFMEGEILKADQQSVRITVRLARGPDGSLPNQWLIEELLHQEWITP